MQGKALKILYEQFNGKMGFLKDSLSP